MSKVCYCNITYQCDNACRYCVSHNVRRHSSKRITVDDYRYFREENAIGEEDIWTISGGEPTLSPYFADIVRFCYQYSKHIIVYSNARNLSSLSEDIIRKIERIIVPLYGDKSVHNDYVGSTKAYEETMDSIRSIMDFDADRLDLKILLDENHETEQLMESSKWKIIENIKHFSITRLLPPDNSLCSRKLVERAEKIIKHLISLDKKIRFYDFPFCWFSEEFRKTVVTMPLHLSLIDSKVICGSAGKRQILFSFDKSSDYFPKCSDCDYSVYCTKIMKNYFCPSLENGQVFIKTE